MCADRYVYDDVTYVNMSHHHMCPSGALTCVRTGQVGADDNGQGEHICHIITHICHIIIRR